MGKVKRGMFKVCSWKFVVGSLVRRYPGYYTVILSLPKDDLMGSVIIY